jgi:hypothetical protein
MAPLELSNGERIMAPTLDTSGPTCSTSAPVMSPVAFTCATSAHGTRSVSERGTSMTKRSPCAERRFKPRGSACVGVEVEEAHEGAVERVPSAARDKLEQELNVREVRVPKLGERTLRSMARAQQVDDAKGANVVAVQPALVLDAIECLAPCAVLRRVGDAQVEARVRCRVATDTGNVNLTRCRRGVGFVAPRGLAAPATLPTQVASYQPSVVEGERYERVARHAHCVLVRGDAADDKRRLASTCRPRRPEVGQRGEPQDDSHSSPS